MAQTEESRLEQRHKELYASALSKDLAPTQRFRNMAGEKASGRAQMFLFLVW